MRNKMMRTHVSIALAGLFFGGVNHADAVNLNYENLSFLEEPIATHIGDTTLDLNALVDGAADIDDDSDKDAILTSRLQLNAETQLDNSLTIGGAYLGEYVVNEDGEYDDNVAVYVGGVWGTASLGDVTGMIQEETGRQLNVGNAELSFDEQLGTLDDKGLSHIGRFGPSRYAFTVDKDENFSIGTIYQRPIGNKDYRFAVNYRDSDYTSSDGSTVFDSKGINFVTALIYGSSIFDIGLGLENLSSTNLDVDRKYVSVGVNRKVGVLSLSAEAHVGDIDGESEVSYAFGAAYDVARGLSLNLGINHSDSQVNIDGVNIVNQDETRGIVSLTYRL